MEPEKFVPADPGISRHQKGAERFCFPRYEQTNRQEQHAQAMEQVKDEYRIPSSSEKVSFSPTEEPAKQENGF